MRTPGTLRTLGVLTASVFLAWLAILVAPPLYGNAQERPQTPAGGSLVIPNPQPPFGGVIARKAKESKPDFPKGVTAPKGAPNVLLILTDDTGFGASSAF